MLSQYELPVSSDATGYAPTRSGILTPTSDHSLNLSDGVSAGSKKRKRDGDTMEDLLKNTFVVKPYPSTVPVKPQTLQPLMLLPRSQLPLSFLDLAPSTSTFPQSRLFEAHVKILELEERMGTQPMVLIARLDDGRTLYAAEREDRGLYVLCRLGSWVNLRQLKAVSVVSRQEISKGAERSFGQGFSQRQEESKPAITAESHKYDRKKRLAIEVIQSMVKRPSTSMPTSMSAESQAIAPEVGTKLHSAAASHQQTQPTKESRSTQPIEESQAPPSLSEPADVIEPLTSIEILENVRTQYLEALYLSKASIAYFAKGPLSRARAAFHLDYDATLEMTDLVSFLESLVLSRALIEKKFRDGVANCVSTIDIHDDSGNDAKGGARPKKKKSVKKIKPGKNGLYPSEEGLIRRWWSNHDNDSDIGAPGNSRDDIAKQRIAELRIRETQLQLVVILEVLALQPLALQSKSIVDDLPSALPPLEMFQGKEKQANSKPKKPDHLSLLIDDHIDRLCIWQSVQAESTNPLGADVHRDVPGVIGRETKPTDNILRDFCIDVIAPFFSARLPERCDVISRQLGGPVVLSPPKPKPKASALFKSSGAPRPGAATKRPAPAKPRRSLQRALTDEKALKERQSMSRGRERAPSLLRSATLPSVPGLKRENSEAPSLSGIPFADSQSMRSKQLARREVDFRSFGANTNVKAQKQAIIDADLKEAISGLKKPNRELAGRDIVESAEKRMASASHSRKQKQPIRNPLFQGVQKVQITATPKASRMKNALSRPQSQHYERAPSPGLETIPPSSLLRIPQSSTKGPATTRNPLFSSIQATPTRSASRMSRNLLGVEQSMGPAFPPSSPLHMQHSRAQLFKVDITTSLSTPISTKNSGIQETPIKQKSVPNFYNHPVQSPVFNQLNPGGEKMAVIEDKVLPKASVMQENIYETLGWDDDADELI